MEYQYFVSESRLFTNMQSWVSEVYVMVVWNGNRRNTEVASSLG